MADTPVKQVLENGPRNYRATYNVAVAAGLAAYVAADPTASGDMGVSIAGNTLYPGTHLKIWELRYNITEGLSVSLTWDASSPQLGWILTGFGTVSFKKEGGLFVPQSAGAPIAGATGKIIFDTIGTPAAGQSISIDMWLKKDIKQ